MIVRISGRGQYDLPDYQRGALDELDDACVAAVEAGDRARFEELWRRMLDLVETAGTPLAEDELVGSDLILPPPDLSFDEAAAEFTGEGLVPD